MSGTFLVWEKFYPPELGVGTISISPVLTRSPASQLGLVHVETSSLAGRTTLLFPLGELESLRVALDHTSSTPLIWHLNQ